MLLWLCSEGNEKYFFHNVADAEVYIDGAFSHSCDDHLQLLRIILTKLQENGFTANPLKCEWAVRETDWLGYWLTPSGLTPWTKNDAIMKMHTPTTLKLLRGFVGMVYYYRDMRSHILAPLTAKTGTPKRSHTSCIPVDTRYANSIWPNESINDSWCAMCIP